MAFFQIFTCVDIVVFVVSTDTSGRSCVQCQTRQCPTPTPDTCHYIQLYSIMSFLQSMCQCRLSCLCQCRCFT